MVAMADSRTVQPVKGVWDVRGNRFNKTGRLDKWAAIDFSLRGQRNLVLVSGVMDLFFFILAESPKNLVDWLSTPELVCVLMLSITGIA